MKSPAISENEFQILAETFLNKVFNRIKSKEFVIEPHWDIDHLCFRVETDGEYEAYRDTLSGLGDLLTEMKVNGRPIATFELHTPIHYKTWLIKLIELPAPKKGKVVKTGFEHLEMVVDISLEDLSKRYTDLDWDKSGLEKTFNPELELELGDFAIKFHNLSLKSVINFENRPKMAILVSELNLLEIFKDHQPFIAGTVPLAVDLPSADLDLLVSFTDVAEFKDMCQQTFTMLPEFEISQSEISKIQYCLCRFDYRGIPVEIFCSLLSTFKQNGYLHFNSEEKILKYAPATWTQQILDLKGKGLKTEPAFAHLLQSGEVDAYQYILDLQRKPIQELRSILRSSLN
ncbi:MAG: hypothetical protein B7Y39_11215 [Bdellovibrio sp. 28-41-41]|nr:MAG: hypothetical protein B7Y39_11215 [Bdellovibrio sp. 28-41-41]